MVAVTSYSGIKRRENKFLMSESLLSIVKAFGLGGIIDEQNPRFLFKITLSDTSFS